jgi:hypothetical protein
MRRYPSNFVLSFFTLRSIISALYGFSSLPRSLGNSESNRLWAPRPSRTAKISFVRISSTSLNHLPRFPIALQSHHLICCKRTIFHPIILKISFLRSSHHRIHLQFRTQIHHYSSNRSPRSQRRCAITRYAKHVLISKFTIAITPSSSNLHT